ncbi:MAG: tetratricopeptide repeat protein [Candidatus Poribacteria bacterium]|nr:tetratricopeptide repeat protein [Candidatus Poribacteria bacterium]
MRMCVNNHQYFCSSSEIVGKPYLRVLPVLFVLLLPYFLYGCPAPDEAQQQRRELQRDALKLEMGQELNPIDPEGHVALGKIYHRLGEHEKAIESFQTALSLDDKHQHAYNNLGLVYVDLRLFILAINMFQAALEIAPENPAFYNNLGYAYDMSDRFDEALEAYRNALDSDPTFVDTYYNLADAYLNRETYSEAIQYYKAGIELDDGDATVYFNLGLAYEETDEVLSAIQAYEKGVSLDADEVEVYYRLALAYQKKKDNVMMNRYLDTFLEKAEGIPRFEKQYLTAKRLRQTSGDR